MMHRRDILKLMAASAVLPVSLSSIQHLYAANAVANGKRLVLVELSGANDGLNTLVPFNNDYYHKLRPTIGLSKNDVISLTSKYALHDALSPLMALWEKGQMAWVQGLGYPKANRSHFKSIELWETGGDGIKNGRHGWITHDIEHNLGRHVNDAHGISLKGGLHIFSSDSGRWMSVNSTSQIETRDSFTTEIPNRNISSIELVASKMNELNRTLTRLNQKLDKQKKAQKLKGGGLGQQLAEVLRLIRSGVDTPVYRVQLSGFDTHTYQLGRHAGRLRELGLALTDFSDKLINDNEWENTLVLTYSEFGRTAVENASGGTDHGTAAPHMLLGGTIAGGLYGDAPDLSQLVDNDQVFTMDYRAVYNRVLQDWFEVDENRFSSFKAPKLDNLLT